MAWTLVQSWTAGENSSGGTSTSTTMGATPTIGNLMIAMSACNLNTQGSVVFQDGNSNVYTNTPHSLFNGASGAVAIAYWIVTGTPSKSISVNWGSSTSLIDLIVAEYSGNALSGVLEIDASATGPGNGISPSFTTTAADLLVAAGHCGGASTITGATNGWTMPLTFGNTDSFNYLLQSAPASAQPGFSVSGGANVDMVMAAFKALDILYPQISM